MYPCQVKVSNYIKYQFSRFNSARSDLKLLVQSPDLLQFPEHSRMLRGSRGMDFCWQSVSLNFLAISRLNAVFEDFRAAHTCT